jgi:hypothetical protein
MGARPEAVELIVKLVGEGEIATAGHGERIHE